MPNLDFIGHLPTGARTPLSGDMLAAVAAQNKGWDHPFGVTRAAFAFRFPQLVDVFRQPAENFSSSVI